MTGRLTLQNAAHPPCEPAARLAFERYVLDLPARQPRARRPGDRAAAENLCGAALFYLVFTLPDGDIAYIKWTLRGVFVRGADGKPTLLDNGFWEVVSGTGKLKELQGAGTLHLKPVSATERKFILEGELVSAKEAAK